MNKTISSPFQDRAEFDAAVAIAQNAALSYYDTDEQVMSDADYDALVERISASVALHSDWDAEGLLDAVAGGQSAGGDVVHPVPMLSLAKAKELTDVDAFAATVTSTVVVEPKFDGLAIRAEYRAGLLSLVATRGDGMTGEDVTDRARTINGLPARLDTPATFEVRGEVYMTDADFETANINRVASGKTAFVNPRNATAGVLRKTDIAYHAPLSFAAYDVSGEGFDTEDSYTARMTTLGTSFGVQTALSVGAATGIVAGDVRDQIAHYGETRSSLGFPIDGAVIKTDSLSERDRLGAVARTPKWAVAFKYAADVATTVLRDIEIAVGRTGRISLRAVLEPVFVGGTTITYATLHNPKFVTDADFRLGDTVFVYRAGDVIPRVNAVDLTHRQADSVRWEAPATCPDCGEAWDKSSLLWRCQTPECSTVGRIEYAASRDVLDIEGLSSAMATALVESGRVNDIADLFTLTAADIAALPVGDGSRQVGQKVAEKIIEGIEKAKSQSLARVITSLGIRKTGRTMGRRLAAQFNSLKALRAASIADLTAVEGIGSEKAAYIHSGLASMGPVIDRLEAFGVTSSQEAAVTAPAAGLPLAGLKVVVTGSVPGLSRGEANEAVEALGGVSTGSVSKTTDLVVVGDGAGSKAEKAEALGVKIMAAEDFAALYAAHTA